MGAGLGEKDTDDDKGRTGRTEPSAHALCGKTDTAAYSIAIQPDQKIETGCPVSDSDIVLSL